MYYFCILKNDYGKLYCGYSEDPQSRLKKHNQSSGAKYTRKYGKFKLVYTEGFGTKTEP